MDHAPTTAAIDLDGLEALLTHLSEQGYEVVGPTRRDGAICCDVVEGVDDLPAGWTDEQEAGRYRLRPRDDGAIFGHVVGPHSPRQELFPPRTLLFSTRRKTDGFEVDEPDDRRRPLAFFGVKSCEVAAMLVQDRVFLPEGDEDPTYRARRQAALIIAVNCTEPGGTCFCASMGTGPTATEGFDLSLTELLDAEGHRFLVEVGSMAGEDLVSAVPHRPVSDAERSRADALLDEAARRMGRRLDTDGLPAALAAELEHPGWDDVAERCLTCANCTMVCPTCFCSTVVDTTDLTGNHAQRWRAWDSCFTLSHSELHGGQVRTTARSRYRQWLTHKFGTWHDQFGVSGCVGCGRCITWCPVGIDVTDELAAVTSGFRPPTATNGSPVDLPEARS